MDQESPAGLQLIAITIIKSCAKKGGSQASEEAGPSLCLFLSTPLEDGARKNRNKAAGPWGWQRSPDIRCDLYYILRCVGQAREGGAVGEHRESRERPVQSAKQILTPP